MNQSRLKALVIRGLRTGMPSQALEKLFALFGGEAAGDILADLLAHQETKESTMDNRRAAEAAQRREAVSRVADKFRTQQPAAYQERAKTVNQITAVKQKAVRAGIRASVVDYLIDEEGLQAGLQKAERLIASKLNSDKLKIENAAAAKERESQRQATADKSTSHDTAARLQRMLSGGLFDDAESLDAKQSESKDALARRAFPGLYTQPKGKQR